MSVGWNWRQAAACAVVALSASAPVAHARIAQDRHAPTPLPVVVVTASPIPTRRMQSMHAVTVVDRADIEHSTARTLADLLAQVNGVAVLRRGAAGVQADVGVNGSDFKETLILVDGVPVQSPQADHLNMDLPVPLAAIERIEIVKGPGSIAYGGSGTGGVINIVTRRPRTTELATDVAFGSHATRTGSVLAGTGDADHSVLLAASATDAGSETPDRPTDAGVRQVLVSGDGRLGRARLRWGAGAIRQQFGAWGFYSDVFPDAREHNRTRMAWLGATLPVHGWQVDAQAYRNRYQDAFLTLIGAAGFLNRHQSGDTGFDIKASAADDHGTTVAGASVRREQIRSNALGTHARGSDTAWLYRRQQLTARLDVALGVNRARYGGYGAYWLPSIAAGWRFNDHWHGFASWARSAREPNYTELYMDTPANVGNAELAVERSTYAEAGVDGVFAAWQVHAAAYARDTGDFIDFVRAPGARAFQARNLGVYRATGFEVDWRRQLGWRWLDAAGLGYSRAHIGLDTAAAKNLRRFPSQSLRAHAQVPLTRTLDLVLDARRQQYPRQPSAILLDVRLQRQWRHVRAYIECSNVINQRVIEAGFAPIPGRWYYVGLGYAY